LQTAQALARNSERDCGELAVNLIW
jgi:hypothetical protein